MMQAILAETPIKRRNPYQFALNVPRVGTVDIEVNGVTRGKSFFDASHVPGKPYVELWAGPVWVLLERNKAVRAERGTNALLAVAALALAGWTEGHLWHLPFLG